ncbi:unnamed protein product [Nezara viridula]|uniref:Lipase n=1 Tax=Nezara viridula TaxID=85310 RepID=A0A9P0MQE5_NEZVI|nr:unnamed protein product [Nezara viridula]
MMFLIIFLNFFAALHGLEGSNGNTVRSPPVIPHVPSIDQLAARGGYKATNYEIITEDGYSIWLHRIGKNSGSPVLIQHGVMVAADSWIIRGRNKKDLAFMLLDNGYDVWLSNQRGTFFNEYSIKYNRTDPRFWDFSFHESGIYDLPAAIDKILEVRKVEKIFYIGHSLGTITFAVMGTMKPEYNNKVEAAMFMSPVVYLKAVNKLPPLIARIAPIRNIIYTALTNSGNFDLDPRNTEVPGTLKMLCGPQAVTHPLCLGIFGFFAGENPRNMNPEDWSNFLLHVSGTSLKNLVHELQLSTSGEFQQFDYGPIGNMKKYNSMKPPKYDLNLLTTPIGLFWCYNDQFADEESVKRLENALPNLLVSFPIADRTFSHLDMVIGDNANIVLYPYIIKEIDSINKKKMREKL